MFRRLLPKEEKYFEHFNEMIAHLAEMAQLTQRLFAADPHDLSLLLQLRPMERRCDEIRAKVVQRLNETFVTPFDREDIFALAKGLEAISDILLGASLRVELFGLHEKLPAADQLTTILTQQLVVLRKAVGALREKSRDVEALNAVKQLETDADHIYQAALRSLFETEHDAIALIKKKEILDMLENASDKCQAVANVVVAIHIKNA
jgi:uncharacterized protein Yka (UPF0111/DUF47 family)